MINPFGLVLTILLYKLAENLKKVKYLRKLPPLLMAGLAIIFVLKIFRIDYVLYKESASLLTYLLIPATISLGYPLYKNSMLLTKNKRIIYSAFCVATLIALLATYLIAYLCKSDIGVILSFLPKSVTAPIAVEISKTLGGIPELTACVVVLTGVFGAVLGHKILSLVGVKNDLAIGLSIGAASHVLGTSSCIEKKREKQVVMSTLALVIVGILTAILAPILIKLV